MSVDSASGNDLASLKDWNFEIDFEGIAWATFDCEGTKVNTLRRQAIEELDKIVSHIESASGSDGVRGLVIMSAKQNFIAGADINEFEDFNTEAQVEQAVKHVIGLFNRIEKLRVPVVAAIHGYCLGGGLELAMACHYRIADRDDGTRLGLPEVKLGIIPGLHGTVRSLKLAGPLDAMQMMLTGRMLRSSAAKRMGLVDKLVPSKLNLRWEARKAVLKKQKSKGASWWKRMLSKAPIRGLLARQMRKQTAKKVREEHYPAPFQLIELFEKFGADPIRHKVMETRYFAPLMVSETSQNLRRVFHLSEKVKGLAPKGAKKPLRAHIIGAGTMGADIAAWCVIKGMEVSLQDLDQSAVDKGVKRAKRLFKKRLKKPLAVEAAMTRLLPDVEGKNVPHADVIIEAIVENLEIKRSLFEDLEARAKPDAILASNTSSLPIEQIAKQLKNPGRLIGIHFFNPVPQLPLVEVIRGENSDEAEVQKGVGFVTAISKFPVIVKSVPGFLVNRVLAPYMFEAMNMYANGTPREKIDQAALKFGMPMGPLELCDVVGLDICQKVGETLNLSDSDDTELHRMVKHGKLGKKSGEGFYVWTDGKPQREDTDFDEDLLPLGERLVKPLLDECEKSLKEGVVDSADMVDAGVIFGTGFAPFRGGPLHYRAKQSSSDGNSATEAS